MNRLQSTLRTVGAVFTSLAQKGVRQLALVPTYLSHLLWLISQTFRELAQKGYGGNPVVYACLRLLTHAVSEPPLVAYLRKPDGSPGAPLAYGHDLARQIREPNPLMTEFERWELLALHLAIVGKSYWWKERDNAGRMIAEWPLRPDRVGPIYGTPADGTGADAVLLGWSYQVPGTSQYVPIPRRDVILYNFPDPVGESGGIVEGLGALQVLAAEVSADNEATRYVGTLLANDARPGLVLEVPTAITDERDARILKAALMRQFGGTKRGEPMVADRGSKITAVGFNLKDLEFPALRRVSESRIAAAIGVPAILVGLLVGLEAAIRATIAEQRELFAETTLASYWRRFAAQYTKDVAAEFGTDIVCRFDLTQVRALAGQVAAEVAKIRDGYTNGALTINEYRAALGYAPRPDGDRYMIGIAAGRGVGTPAQAADPGADVAQENDLDAMEDAA